MHSPRKHSGVTVASAIVLHDLFFSWCVLEETHKSKILLLSGVLLLALIPLFFLVLDAGNSYTSSV